MNDLLSELIADSGPTAKDIQIRGQMVPVYFRRISAGERAQLTRGQKVTSAGGGSTSVEIDVSENITSQHMLVHFSVCDEKGAKRFRTLKEVQAIDADIVSALYAGASEHNSEGDAGKG